MDNEDVSLLDDEASDVEEDVAEGGYNELFFFDFECRQENGTHKWLFMKEHANCIKEFPRIRWLFHSAVLA